MVTEAGNVALCQYVYCCLLLNAACLRTKTYLTFLKFILLDHAFPISRPSSSPLHRVSRGGGTGLRRPREGVVLPPVPPDAQPDVLLVPVHQRAQLHPPDQPRLGCQPRAPHVLQVCRQGYRHGAWVGLVMAMIYKMVALKKGKVVELLVLVTYVCTCVCMYTWLEPFYNSNANMHVVTLVQISCNCCDRGVKGM